MIKIYHLIAGIILFGAIQACTERAICPAYQSAFIHDKEVLERHFSYFGEDSMPKVMEASKDKFLIIEPMSYRKKLRSLQTIPMEDVYPQEDDSLAFEDEFYLAEREGYDSTAVIAVDTLEATAADSVYMISLKKEKFNIDQELYLWYLREYLVYPDVALSKQQAAEASALEAQKGKKKKGFFGFFKNLFSKKDKSDNTNFDVETSATELNQEEPKEKKGPFGFLKKNKDKKKNKAPKEEDEDAQPTSAPPSNEDEDDGEDDF
ncbi:hypothetical protein LVD17_27465 [Fulvivirga ulvae]|uniref:hypothetical protein n=1 Tax=Fulvivirga ulvae TaxID=2904245 RepID=UPI001F2157A6|nr:hypothetical protein [Fulvivirga ulvae]UII32029.1 hypothetical protein LVD17_27465 [Fulvivirga ulvae]